MSNSHHKHNRNRLARIKHGIMNVSNKTFIALTNDADGRAQRKAIKAATIKRDEEQRAQMRRALSNGFKNWYPDGMRYHVSISDGSNAIPTFNARTSLTATSSERHAITYAALKLRSMVMTGDYRAGEILYVWDLGKPASPSGVMTPIARYWWNPATNEMEHD